MVKVDVGALHEQNAAIKKFCQAAKEAGEELISSTQNIKGFEGKAGASINHYLSTAYPALGKAIVLYAETYEHSHQKYVNEYDHQCKGESRDSEKLERQIQMANQLIQAFETEAEGYIQAKHRYSMAGPLAESIQDQYNLLIQSIQQKMESTYHKKVKLEKKLEELLAFNAASTSYFSEVHAMESLMNQGLEALGLSANGSIGAGCWNGHGFSTMDYGWINKVNKRWKKEDEISYTNAFLELYNQTRELLKPITGTDKSDNVKRLEMLFKAYPAAVVKKLLKNEEFWELANKLPSSMQTKLINGLANYEALGKAVAQGKWLPKIDTIGKAFEYVTKATNPIKTYVSESLKASQFVQNMKNWGVAKGLGKASTVATYAQLGITFASSGVSEYGKTGSIGKGVIGGTIDAIKSVGPLEGMTIGAAAGGLPGAAIGGVLGSANVIIQFINPNLYDDIKNGAYKLYDKGTETVKSIGKGFNQGVNTVKSVFKDIKSPRKLMGKVLSSVKIPKIRFGW